MRMMRGRQKGGGGVEVCERRGGREEQERGRNSIIDKRKGRKNLTSVRAA